MSLPIYMLGIAVASLLFYSTWIDHRRVWGNTAQSDITYAAFVIFWPAALVMVAVYAFLQSFNK